MKKILTILALLTVTLFGIGVSAQSNEPLNYTPAQITANPDNSPEAIQLQQCLPSGATVLRCGCYGPAMPGQSFPAAICCSGSASAFPCTWFCPYGGRAWYNICD